MKEQSLIEMKNKLDATIRVLQQVMDDQQYLRTLAAGTFETVKLLPGYDEAIKALDKSTDFNHYTPYPTYDRACVYSLKKDKQNTLKDLADVISKGDEYKKWAKENKDFQWLWEDEEFKKIVDSR